eukprot:366209-Chlamydomonas_euryale.AAC.4
MLLDLTNFLATASASFRADTSFGPSASPHPGTSRCGGVTSSAYETSVKASRYPLLAYAGRLKLPSGAQKLRAPRNQATVSSVLHNNVPYLTCMKLYAWRERKHSCQLSDAWPSPKPFASGRWSGQTWCCAGRACHDRP